MGDPGNVEKVEVGGGEGAEKLVPEDLTPSPEKKNFYNRFKKPINVLTALALIGGAWAGLNGKVGAGAGGGFEVTNPFNGERLTVGLSVGTRTEMEDAGIPESVLDEVFSEESEPKFFEIKIGSAILLGYAQTNNKDISPKVGIFTAGRVKR